MPADEAGDDQRGGSALQLESSLTEDGDALSLRAQSLQLAPLLIHPLALRC